MKTNGKRKIVLLGVLAVLVSIYCIQVVVAGKNEVRVVSVKDEPDSIVIHSGNGTEVRLDKDGDAWVVGGEKYPASASAVQELCENIQSIKLLGTAARSAGDEEERYGLDAGNRIAVTAYKDGKEIQSLLIGKDTSTNRQCFVQLKTGSSVYLADGGLHSAFAVTVDDLRSKEVYSFDGSEISAVTLAKCNQGDWKSFTLKRSEAEETEEGLVTKKNWLLDGENTGTLDDDKVSSWVRMLSVLNASEWLDDGFSIAEENSDFSMTIFAKDKTVKLRGYEKDDETYLWCSEVPYCFKVASYVGARFTKTLSDFSKDVEVD